MLHAIQNYNKSNLQDSLQSSPENPSPKMIDVQAIIMAGGKGTRLSAITRDEIPKPMVPVLGKPILQWQIEKLRENGISNITIVIGHLGSVIKNYFGDGSDYNVSIRYFDEKEPLGSAGALAYLARWLLNDTFILIFADLIFDIDLRKMLQFHKNKEAAITLFAHPNSHPFDSDILVVNDEELVVAIDLKSNVRDYWYHNCVNAGIYVCDKFICEMLSPMQLPQKIDMDADIVAKLVKNKSAVYAYRSTEYIKDSGTEARLQEVEYALTRFASKRNMEKPQKAVFIDRDGTINAENSFIYRDEQLELLPNTAEAIKVLNASEYLAIVVTNQPVVARGLTDICGVERIHMKLETLLGQKGAFLDAIYYCPHHPDKGYPEENPLFKVSCNCRKPKIGMLEEAANRHNVKLTDSWVIGDRTVDIQTGKNAGTKTILVCTGEAGMDATYEVQPDYVCADLLEAINLILKVS